MEPKWDSAKNRSQNRQPHPLAQALPLPLTYSASCPQIPELEPRNALECATLSGHCWKWWVRRGWRGRDEWMRCVFIYFFFGSASPRLPRLAPRCGASRGVARSVGWRFLSHQLYHFPSPDRWATLLGRHCRRRHRRCCVSVVRAKFQLICRLFSPLYILLFLYLVVGI